MRYGATLSTAATVLYRLWSESFRPHHLKILSMYSKIIPSPPLRILCYALPLLVLTSHESLEWALIVVNPEAACSLSSSYVVVGSHSSRAETATANVVECVWVLFVQCYLS